MASRRKNSGSSDSSPSQTDESNSQTAELPSGPPAKSGDEVSADPAAAEPAAQSPADPQDTSDSDIDENLAVDSTSHDAIEGQDTSPTTSDETFTEAVYERTPTGHRVIRRTVTLKRTEEYIDEEIEEDFFPSSGHQAPLSTSHPAPVG